MIVREAGPDEGEDIRALLTAAYDQYAAAVPVAELFRHYLDGVTDLDGAAGRAATLVAESGGRIAGTARYYPPGRVDEVPGIPGDWAWVRAVGVHPAARGGGVARELMAECLRRAPELDLDIAEYYGVGGEMVALGYRLDVTS